MDLTQAIKAAIKYCVKHNIMAEYLKTHEAEVCNMLFQEFTYKDIAEVRYDEGREDGRTEGERAKALSIAHNALIRGMPIADIADITNLTYKEIDDLRNLN